MYHKSHSEGTCVLLEIPSMHKLVQYFQTLHRNEDIYDIATFEPHLFSSNVEHCSISNVNSYQCSCKQCCPIALYAMCYSLIILVDTGLKEIYWPLLVTGILYNVMGVTQSVSISGADINLTLRAITTYVLCCNLAPSMSALKMCIF